MAPPGFLCTHVTTTEVLDPMYALAFRVDSRYERYFKPTMVTDAAGRLTDSQHKRGLAWRGTRRDRGGDLVTVT